MSPVLSSRCMVVGGMSQNAEKPWGWGGPGISEMSAESLITQVGKAKQHNVANALRIRAGGPLPKGPLPSYRPVDMGGIPGNLPSLWGSKKRHTGLYNYK